MADEKDVNFKLNLDNESFLKSGLEAQDVIKGIGNSENMAGLLEGLANVGIALGTVGVAAFAFKAALDLTLEAEQIQRVEKSFEILAANAGISAEELKQGMLDASGGLIATNDLLKIANEALVKMGSSAERLPEIMELARKATTVFGGDLTSNFENITNAIANGNTRLLKHYGILVDAKKAVDDFAKANGIAINEISAAGKQQAILNAVLEQSKKAFDGVSEDTNSATTSVQLLKATFAELSEAFALAFEKVIGPGVRSFLLTMKDMASTTKTYMQSAFGDETTKAAANVKLMEDRIKDLQTTIDTLQKKKGTGLDFAPADTISRLSVLPGKLKELQSELEKLKAIQVSLGGVEKHNGEQREAQAGKDIRDEATHLANAIKFKAELEKIDKGYLQAQMQNVQTFEHIEENVRQQNELAEKEHATRLKEINKSTTLDSVQKYTLLLNEERKYSAEIESIEFKNDILRKKMLDNYVKNSTSAFNGIERAFAANTKKMEMDNKDFGTKGTQDMEAFKTYSVSAFSTMGAEMAKGRDIASATADAIKSIFLNMIADQAIAEGSKILLASVFPVPNPLGLAAGAGLIALGGALRSVSGSSYGGGSSVSAVSVPTVGGVSGGATNMTPLPSTSADSTSNISSSSSNLNMAQTQNPQRIVNVNIAGNYMETDATRRQLMEMMRQETDATDFTYNKIGV